MRSPALGLWRVNLLGTSVHKGKRKGRGPDVGPRLFRLSTLQLCCPRPLLTTGSEAPPVVPGCLIAATQLVARQVFHAACASLYLDCVLRPGRQIRRGQSDASVWLGQSYNTILVLIGVVVPYLTSIKVEVVSVVGSIFSENVTLGQVLRATFVAPGAGLTLLTVGAVLSSTVTVTKLEAVEVLPPASMALAE
jgi:hypothetical protein